MPIIINTEKVWKDGQQYRKILGFKALTFKQIPKEYHERETGPCCFYVPEENHLIVWEKVISGFTYMVRKDDIIKEETFQTIIFLVRKAGDRLMKINKRLAEERAKQWSGKEKFTI